MSGGRAVRDRRRALARAAGLVVLLGLLLACLTASTASASASASASPAIPGIPDCKDAPAPQMPGDGLPGFLDPTPATPAPPADPFVTSKTTSVYDQFGYAGLTWHTYDLGCAGGLGDPGATSDTLIGNLGLSAAAWGVATANGIHNKIAHPQDYMAPIDQVVGAVTDRVEQAIWGPWGGVALMGVVVILLWYSLGARLSAVTRGAAWAVLVLTVLAAVTSYPTRVSAFFDEAITGSIGQIDQATAGITNPPPGSDPARAQGGLLVDHLLYDAWLRGELGSSTSASATKWGPTLFKASTFSYDEARQAQDPAAARRLIDQKATTFKDTAAQIQQEDPSAYANLQGKTGSRVGVGLVSAFAMLFTVLFRLVADGFLFAGLVMLRFLVMLFPAVAVLGVMAPMSSIVHRVANMAGAAVVNVIAFTAGSAVHTTIISALLSQSTGLGMGVLTLLLCLVVSLVAFVLLLPLLSLTSIVGLSSGHRGVNVLKRAGRLAAQYAVTRRATSDGQTDDKEEEGGDDRDVPTSRPTGRSASRPSVAALGQERYLQGDAFARPWAAAPPSPMRERDQQIITGEVINDEPIAISGAGSPPVRSDPLYLPRGSEPPTDTGMPNGDPGDRHGNKTLRAGGAVDTRLSAKPSENGGPTESRRTRTTPSVKLGERPIQVVRGPVVRSDEEPVDREPVHDNHFRLGADGIRPVFFDPSTKREFVADRFGATIEAAT